MLAEEQTGGGRPLFYVKSMDLEGNSLETLD